MKTAPTPDYDLVSPGQLRLFETVCTCGHSKYNHAGCNGPCDYARGYMTHGGTPCECRHYAEAVVYT